MPYRPRNSRNYYASFKDARGKRVRRSCETTDYQQASALEGKWKAEVWRQIHWGERPRYTFEQVIEPVLDATTDRKSHERDLYAAKALGPYFSGRVIADLTGEDFSAHKIGRLLDVSIGTLIKELSFFSSSINYANREWDWNVPNVVAGRIPEQPPGRIRWLRIEESARLLHAATHPRSASYLHDMIVLALNTGLRHRELLQLTWDRIDWSQGLIYFYPDDHKSEREDSTPLNSRAHQILLARWATRPTTYVTRDGRTTAADLRHVFLHRGQAIYSAKKSFATACRRANVADCTIHDLRHTFASRLVQNSVPIATVKEVMRHASIQTTMRYAHLAPENSRAAVARLEGYDQIQTQMSPNLAKSG